MLRQTDGLANQDAAPVDGAPEPARFLPRSLSHPRGIALAILVLALTVRIAAWAADPDLWLDEAMLYQALKDQAAILPWLPLGQYTQATPIVPALLWKALIAGFGPDGLMLRLPSLLAAALGLCVLGPVLRRRVGTIGTGAALLLVAFSATAILQSAQLKPYSFEFLASALILDAATRLATAPEDRRALASFTLVSIAALSFTYTAPVATAASAFGLAAAHRPDRRRRWPLVACGVLWAIAGALWQVFVVAPSTRLQFAGNARSYAWEYLVPTRPETWHHIGRVLKILDPALPLASLATLVTFGLVALWSAGLALGWRRRLFEHGTCLGALACLALLSFAGLFPFAEPRKMLFLLPIFALSFGAAIDDLAAWRRVGISIGGGAAGILVFALVLFPFSLEAALRSGKEQVAELIDAVPPGVCPRIWSFYLAWPAIETYRDRRPDIAFIGAIPTASGVPSWSWRIHDTFPAYARSLARSAEENPGLCLLFSHVTGEVQRQEKQALLEAVALRRCRDILDRPGARLYRCE